jgi:hypothetical protein
VSVSAHVLANEVVSADGAKQGQTIANGESEVVGKWKKRKYILLDLGLIIVSTLLYLDNGYGAHQDSQCRRY